MTRAPPNSESNHTPPDPSAGGDETLGGYMALHHRPPAFEGSDGYPYTVSVEVELTPDLAAPFMGYLVFPRWAENGAGIIGHIETPIILHGKIREEVEEGLRALGLTQVRELLDQASRPQQTET
mgnify:CR=1 FL=1